MWYLINSWKLLAENPQALLKKSTPPPPPSPPKNSKIASPLFFRTLKNKLLNIFNTFTFMYLCLNGTVFVRPRMFNAKVSIMPFQSWNINSTFPGCIASYLAKTERTFMIYRTYWKFWILNIWTYWTFMKIWTDMNKCEPNKHSNNLCSYGYEYAI